jgi:hypothetical protein
VLSTPFYNLIDPMNHLRGQNGLLISLSGRVANILANLGPSAFSVGVNSHCPKMKKYLLFHLGLLENWESIWRNLPLFVWKL